MAATKRKYMVLYERVCMTNINITIPAFFLYCKKVKLKLSFRLSALSADRPLPPRRFLVLISARGRVDPRGLVRLEGLRQLKNPTTSMGIELATFRLVV
jgi:hypothetical protein